VEDWKKSITDMFRVANKKVIISNQYPFEETSYINNKDESFDWRWGYNDFNMLVRNLSVNVSYGMAKNVGSTRDSYFIVVGKHMDDVIFDLDDMSVDKNPMPILLELKERFPKFKVNLMCIVSQCPKAFITELKEKYGDWIQFCLHGDLHDTEHGVAQETNYWSAKQMNDYLDDCEKTGLYEKVFRAPGWNMNIESYQVLIERGYIICEHLAHDRWEEMGGKRYTTGHLWEVHGHTWACNMNGVEELATTKCNFGDNTNFHFISEAPLDIYLPGRYQ
jgi:hypothetical protein